MVTIHFAFIAILALGCFSLGRTFGRVECSLAYQKRISAIVEAVKKAEQLAALKGESLASLSTEEIVHRTQKQMEIKENEND
jgi:proline racemase